MMKMKNRVGIAWRAAAMLVFLGVVGGWYLLAPAAAKSASAVDCRVELDKNVLSAGKAQKAVVKVTLDAPPPPKDSDRPPVNLAIVLDRSGSMSGRKLEKAKDAAIEALRRLGKGDMFSVVVYDHNVTTIVPAQSASNAEWIEARIRNIAAGGNTALFSGVSQGAAEVRKHIGGKYVHRIILLSDGLANVGPSTPGDLGRLGAALLKENISVTTVGVGTDYNEDLMAGLSQNSDGNTYFVESSKDLPRIFAAELGDVLSVVARKVHLVIELPNGVRPVTIVGREGRIKGRKVELSMNQLYGGQEKFALVEVEIPKGKAGKDMEIALAKVSYENLLRQRRETSTGQARVRFSKNRAEVKKSTNVAVQRDYQLNMSAIAQEKAITLADQGKKKEAVRALKQSARQLEEMGNEHDDARLLGKAAEVEKQADRIEAEGMTPSSRKVLRTKSFQMKNQQPER